MTETPANLPTSEDFEEACLSVMAKATGIKRAEEAIDLLKDVILAGPNMQALLTSHTEVFIKHQKEKRAPVQIIIALMVYGLQIGIAAERNRARREEAQ